jgi:hypothetical protein
VIQSINTTKEQIGVDSLNRTKDFIRFRKLLIVLRVSSCHLGENFMVRENGGIEIKSLW